MGQVKEARMLGEKEPDDEVEGKDLPVMGVPRELQVKEAQGVLVYYRYVFKEQSKSVFGQARKQCFLRDTFVMTEVLSRGIIDAGDANHPARGGCFAPQHGKPGIIHK